MIERLKKAIAAAEKASGKCDDRRFYDGYITGIKYAITVIKESSRDKALNPFTKGVE